MLSQKVRFPSFLWPSSIPFCKCTTAFLSTYLLINLESGRWATPPLVPAPHLVDMSDKRESGARKSQREGRTGFGEEPVSDFVGFEY